MSRWVASAAYTHSLSRRPWWRCPDVVVAVSLFITDALVLGQGLLAALLLITVFGGLVPQALLLRKLRRDVWPTARLAVLFGVTAVAIMTTINLNNHLARQRASDVVAAIELYYATNGRFPLVLEALVPRFLAAVPRAKFTLAFNDFIYQPRTRDAVLAYVEVPPFARLCYDFAERRWHNDIRRMQHITTCGRSQAVAQQEPER